MLAISLFVSGGCGRSTEQPSGVAVVDLDQVLVQLGTGAKILAAIKEREANLNQQLASAKATYENQLRATQAKLNAQPTQEKNQQLAILKQQANKQLKQVALQAKGNLEQHRAQLLIQFRDEAKQAARQVAYDQNLSIVITKNDAVVLVYNEAVDITSEVAQRMQSIGEHSEQIISK